MTVLVATLRKDSGDKAVDYHATKIHLITDVLEYARTKDGGKAFAYDEDDATWRLIDEFGEPVDIARVKYGDHLLIRPRTVPDLFNREIGAWREGSRSFTPEGLKDLRTSMQTFGWQPHLPAIQDENDVVLVGRRRLAVAEELEIKPVIETIRFGEGEAADAARVALVLASNLGGEKIGLADRKKICEDLYLAAWSMPKIAELLKVSSTTVWRDLQGFTNVKPPDPKRGGRPKKKSGDATTPNSASGSNGSSGSADNDADIKSAASDGQSGADESSELELFDSEEMELLEEVHRKAEAARPKQPKPPYVLSWAYDKLAWNVDDATLQFLLLFVNPRFEKKIGALTHYDRDRVDVAIGNLDTARSRLQEVRYKLDAEPYRTATPSVGATEKCERVMTWKDLFPNGRHIFYEGDEPEVFAQQIRDEFGFDPRAPGPGAPAARCRSCWWPRARSRLPARPAPSPGRTAATCSSSAGRR